MQLFPLSTGSALNLNVRLFFRDVTKHVTGNSVNSVALVKTIKPCVVAASSNTHRETEQYLIASCVPCV